MEGTMDLNGKGGKLKMELPSSPRASLGKDNDNAHCLTLSNRSSGSTPAKSSCLLSDKKLPEESSKLEDITDRVNNPIEDGSLSNQPSDTLQVPQLRVTRGLRCWKKPGFEPKVWLHHLHSFTIRQKLD